MGYSESRATLERIKGDLQPIADGKACQWQVKDISARAYAYKLREGLYIASLYPGEYPELALNGPYFTIEVVDRGRGIVQARPKPGFQTQVSVMSPHSPGVAVQGLANQGAPDEIMGIQTAIGVVDAWSRVGHQNHRVRFPQAQLGRADLISIYNWSRRQEPVVLMFVTPEGALTLKHKTIDSEAALAWGPEDD
jgi:hypothetical protein